MTRRSQDILKEAMGMPERERAAIAHGLIRSLEGPADRRTEAEWKEEIDRRIEKFRSGQTKSIRWETLRDRLRKRARATA